MSAPVFMALGLYLAITALMAALQAYENRTARRDDKYWAPVWWVALTWPFWFVWLGLVRPFRGLGDRP